MRGLLGALLFSLCSPCADARRVRARRDGFVITPCSVTIACTSRAGVTSNAGFAAALPRGAVGTPPTVSTSCGGAVLHHDRGAVGRREVDRRTRRGDHERDAVVVREHGERIGADLVGDVAVRGDAVGAHHHEVDLAPRHQRPGRAVDHDRVRDPEPVELPRRESRALEHGPGLVDPHRGRFPLSAAARITPSAVP